MKVIPPLALLFSLAALAISLIRQPEPSSEKTSLSTGRLEARIRSLENELAELANATRQPVNEFQDPLTNQPDSNLPLDPKDSAPTKLEQQLRDLGVLEHFRKQKAKLSEARSLVLDAERDQWERVKTLSSLRDGGEIDDEIVSS
ncbi:MAG: hypothetical protein P8M04_07960, partial [Akkermansiaceae bacterium]|nr:hypothetical protein [Akkermansiaceae bacterium]